MWVGGGGGWWWWYETKHCYKSQVSTAELCFCFYDLVNTLTKIAEAEKIKSQESTLKVEALEFEVANLKELLGLSKKASL